MAIRHRNKAFATGETSKSFHEVGRSCKKVVHSARAKVLEGTMKKFAVRWMVPTHSRRHAGFTQPFFTNGSSRRGPQVEQTNKIQSPVTGKCEQSKKGRDLQLEM